LIIGDSQANGWPGRQTQELLERKGHVVARRAYDGVGAVTWRSQRSEEYQDLLRRVRPDSVILIFGSNNLAGPALESAMKWFANSSSRVYYSGPPNYANVDRRPIGDAIRRLGQQVFGSRYIDAYAATSNPNLYQPDKIHMNAEGGLKWATAIAGKAPGAESIWPWVGLGLGSAAVAAIFIRR